MTFKNTNCTFFNTHGECVETYAQHIETGLSIFYKYFDNFFKFSKERLEKLLPKATNDELKNLLNFIITESFIFHDAGKLTEIYHKKPKHYRHELFSLLIMNKLYIENSSFRKIIDNPIPGKTPPQTKLHEIKSIIATLVFYHHEFFMFNQFSKSELSALNFDQILNMASKFNNLKFNIKPINTIFKKHYPTYTPKMDEITIMVTASSMQYIKPLNVNSRRIALASKLFNILVFLDNLSASLNRGNQETIRIFKDVYCYNKLFYRIINDVLGGC